MKPQAHPDTTEYANPLDDPEYFVLTRLDDAPWHRATYATFTTIEDAIAERDRLIAAQNSLKATWDDQFASYARRGVTRPEAAHRLRHMDSDNEYAVFMRHTTPVPLDHSPATQD